MKTFCVAILLLLGCASIADAQPEKITTLERQLARTKTEKLRLERMVTLAEMLQYVHPPRALEYGRAAMALAEARQDSGMICRACIASAMGLAAMGVIDSGMILLERSVTISRMIRDTLRLGEAYLGSSQLHGAKGWWGRALELCQSAKRLTLVAEDSINHVRALLLEPRLSWSMSGDREAYCNSARRALRIAEGLGVPRLVATGRFELGSAYLQAGMFDAAEQQFEQALRMFDSLGLAAYLPAVLTNLGNIAIYKNMPERAIEYLATSIRLREAQGNISTMPYALGSLGEVNFQVHRYADALECYERSRHFAEAMGNHILVADALRGKGKALNALGRWNDALVANENALAVHERLAQPLHAWAAMRAIIDLYKSRGNFHKALDMLHAYRQRRESAGDIFGMMSSNLAAGNILLYNERRLPEAYAAYSRSLELSEQLDHRQIIAQSANGLGEVYLEEKRYDEALPHFLRSMALLEKDTTDIVYRSLHPWTALRIAEIHAHARRWTDAVEYARRSIVTSERFADTRIVAMASRVLAIALSYSDPATESLTWAHRARALLLEPGERPAAPDQPIQIPWSAYKVPDSAYALDMEYLIADTFEDLGLYEEAMSVHYRILTNYHMMPEDRSMHAWTGIANILEQMGRFEEAMEYRRKVLDLATATRYRSWQIDAERGIGMNHLHQGQYDKALAALERSRIVMEQLARDPHSEPFDSLVFIFELRNTLHPTFGRVDATMRAMHLIAKGHVLQALGDDAAAEECWNEAIRFAVIDHNRWLEGQLLGTLGKLHAARGDHEYAIHYLQNALAISEDAKHQSRIVRLKSLGNSHALLGHWQQAYASLSRASALNDSLKGEERNHKVLALYVAFESERTEQEIRERIAQRALDEASLSLQQDSLVRASLELRHREAALCLRRSRTVRLRQQAALLGREHELQSLSLARRTVERDARIARVMAANTRATGLQRERERARGLAERERDIRNALLGVLSMLLAVGVLGGMRMRDRRRADTLRAEAAEHRARTAAEQALARSEERERRAHEAQRAFSHRLIASQEQERARVSSELHDGLSQHLIVIKNRAAMVRNPDATPGQIVYCLEEVIAMAATALEDVRRISRALRPYQIEQIGLTDTLRTTLQRVVISSGLRVAVEIADVDRLLAPEDEIRLYRLLQEAVSNILRHAHATVASVRLGREDGALRLCIRDDGCGFDVGRLREHAPVSGGLGLRSMAERVEMMHGRMTLRSSPGNGTECTIVIPIPGVHRVPSKHHVAEGVAEGGVQ